MLAGVKSWGDRRAGADLGCSGSPVVHDNLRDMCQLEGGHLLVSRARGSWQVLLDLLCPGRQDVAHAQVKGADHGPWVSVLKELWNACVQWKGLIHVGRENGMPFLPMPLLAARSHAQTVSVQRAVTHTLCRIKEWFRMEGTLKII